MEALVGDAGADAVPARTLINDISAIFILCKVIQWAGLDPLAGQFLSLTPLVLASLPYSPD